MLNCQTGMELMLKARLWIDNLQSWGEKVMQFIEIYFMENIDILDVLEKYTNIKVVILKGVYSLVLQL